MPYGDGTGPYGTGPIGMRRGKCYSGMGTSWPMWRGIRPSLRPEEEKEYLHSQKEEMEELLEDITRRLQELESK